VTHSQTRSQIRSQKRVLAVIPAYNEEQTIAAVISEINEHLPDAKIIVIDDSSTDTTLQAAEELGVAVIRLPINLGIGGAVQTGFLYAAQHGWDYVLQIDGDGQHPASEAHKILDIVTSGEADVAVGSRFLERGGSRSTASRRLGIRLLRYMSRMTSGVSIMDCTSGFRAYNRRAVAFLEDFYPSDYPEVETITRLARNGFRIAEVSVTMRERQGGRSSIKLTGALYYMVKVTLASFISRFRTHPQSLPRKSE
jgi:glycosyltransferase involved in cell wall biosynthesis